MGYVLWVINFFTTNYTCRWSYLRKAIRHYPQIKEMLAQSSKCAVCGESFLNTWLECVRFVDAREDLKLNNLSGLIPVRALLCSYRCFNSSGHDYYGVAFPWSLNEPSPKEWVCPREITVISFDSCGYVLIKQSWPINTCEVHFSFK